MFKFIFLLTLISNFAFANEDLCQKGVRFEGDCEAMHSVYEYDQKEKTCLKREGSGCRYENGFVTETECLEVCAGSSSLFERISKKTKEKLGD